MAGKTCQASPHPRRKIVNRIIFAMETNLKLVAVLALFGLTLGLFQNGALGFEQPTLIEDIEILTTKKLTLEDSPYLIDHDILVRPEGELVIEPGVEVRIRMRVSKATILAKIHFWREIPVLVL